MGAALGKWFSAEYSTEGMMHAWSSGKASTKMMLVRKVEGKLVW